MSRQHLAPHGETRERVYACIRRRILTTGLPPTYEDIRADVGIRSTSTVHAHLARLEKDGRIEREPGAARAIRLPRTAPCPVEACLAEMLMELQAPAPRLEVLEGLVVRAAETLKAAGVA